MLFNSPIGLKYLKDEKRLNNEDIKNLSLLGLSSICNILAAIKTAKYFELGENDVIITVATDPAFMYNSEIPKIQKKYFNNHELQEHVAAEIFGQHLKAINIDHYQELSRIDKERIFNLGYYTWVEQQGVDLKDFNLRKEQSFWKDLKKYIPIWDNMIQVFNQKNS